MATRQATRQAMSLRLVAVLLLPVLLLLPACQPGPTTSPSPTLDPDWPFGTPTLVPSPTPRPTLDPRLTPSPEPTPAPTESASATPRPSPTPGPSPSEAPSPTPIVSPTPAPSPTVPPTPTPNPRPYFAYAGLTDQTLSRVRTDGSGREQYLPVRVVEPVLAREGWLYFFALGATPADRGLYRVPADAPQSLRIPQLLYRPEAGFLFPIGLQGEYLYAIHDPAESEEAAYGWGALVRIRIDGPSPGLYQVLVADPVREARLGSRSLLFLDMVGVLYGLDLQLLDPLGTTPDPSLWVSLVQEIPDPPEENLDYVYVFIVLDGRVLLSATRFGETEAQRRLYRLPAGIGPDAAPASGLPELVLERPVLEMQARGTRLYFTEFEDEGGFGSAIHAVETVPDGPFAGPVATAFSLPSWNLRVEEDHLFFLSASEGNLNRLYFLALPLDGGQVKLVEWYDFG